jgi:ribonuclease HI
MRLAYNLDPKYRVMALTREDWTASTWTPPCVTGHACYPAGSPMPGAWGGGTGAGVFGQSVKRRLNFSLGRYASVFQAEVLTILACAHDIKDHGMPEKHVSICSDSLAALRALEAARMTSPLVRQCQEVLNDISFLHTVGLYWVAGHVGVRGNEMADRLMRNGSASEFVGPELALGVSQQELRNKISRWLGNQHRRRWQNLGSAQ